MVNPRRRVDPKIQRDEDLRKLNLEGCISCPQLDSVYYEDGTPSASIFCLKGGKKDGTPDAIFATEAEKCTHPPEAM